MNSKEILPCKGKRMLFGKPTDTNKVKDEVMKTLFEKAAEKWGFDFQTAKPVKKHTRWSYELVNSTSRQTNLS